MRVLIIRPEREATALATALRERGHAPVIAPLFTLEFLHPPAEFSAALATCQAVLLTSANGARALAEASDQRGRSIFAVGDTTASTAEGLGFASVTSAGGSGEDLAALVRQRLTPGDGPLLHVSGNEIAVDLGEALKGDGFEVRRFALYDAREASALPDSARAALEARALDIVPFFSPRAAALFARLVEQAGLAESLRGVTAIGISPAALAPLAKLSFKSTVAAVRPTRQAVLDEIDRLAEASVADAGVRDANAQDASVQKASVQDTGTRNSSARHPGVSEETPSMGPWAMSDEPSAASSPPPLPPPPPLPAPVMRRGLGVAGAFVTGVIAALLVLAGTLVSLPFWPPQLRERWQGQATALPAASGAGPAIDLQAVRADATAAANAAIEAARRELAARVDELDKRVRALATTVAERPASAPATTSPTTLPAAPASQPDPAIAELRRKIEALEARPIPPSTPPSPPPSTETAAPTSVETEKEIAILGREVAVLRESLQTLDRTVTTQREQTREQTKALHDAVNAAVSARSGSEEKALTSARASAVIGVAARLSAALDSGQPFANDLNLLTPLIQGDSKLAEIANGLQPFAQKGVASRVALEAAFPAVAKAALADDLADDSMAERVMGKIRGLVSLRRVGDVPGDTTEARLARAEAALHAGDLAKAVDLVKSLPPQTAKATADWLARAEANLAAGRSVDQLAAHAVNLLGTAR